MGKCPHCGSSRIRKRYRQHRRYNWRCRRCNNIFRRPKRSVWLWIGAIAVISIAVAYVYSQDIISIPSTPARVDESVDGVVKVMTYTATPETAATQTPVQSAAPVDTPTMTTMSSVPTYTAIPTRTPRPTSTTSPTRTPRPIYTPRPTTTTPPAPTQIPGRADLYKTLPLPQGLAYVWWHWEDRVRGFQSIDFDLTIHNDIDAREMPDDAGLYLILFSSDISGTGYYFGIQTDVYDPEIGRGRGKGLIFSRWGTRDLSDVRVAPDGWHQSAGYEGDFVGVRKAYRWGEGDYGVRIAADGDDDEGRWFGLWITDKATGETTWCGSLRFDKSAKLEPVGGTAPEIYGAGTTCCCLAIPSMLTAERKCPHDGACEIDAARTGKASSTQQFAGGAYDDGTGIYADGSEHTPYQAHTGGIQEGRSSRTRTLPFRQAFPYHLTGRFS